MTNLAPQDLFDLDPVPAALRPGLHNAIQQYLDSLAAQELSAPVLPPEAARVWACSRFVAQACSRAPAMLAELVESGDLGRAYAPGELAARTRVLLETAEDDTTLDRYLRHHRRREMVRIAWRDLAGAATLEETLGDATDLAEFCIDETLRWHHRQLVQKHGQPCARDDGSPQQLVVLGMGKLGGRELNYSSDIDLIFAYPEDGETDGERAIDNHQFFQRLGQRLIKSLDAITADGFVFRVDMRLRPFGDAGPLVMSFSAMEDYYQAHGREWERYAMIKARVIAGDRAAGAELEALLRPFIYRRYLDYGAFASLREMKAMINRETERKGLVGNVKLGAGGIREVEFIGQAFQLIRGGRDPYLQERGIQEVLRRLVERELLPHYVEHQLQRAYAFLRRTENHIQMWADQQAHALPTDTEGQLRLAYSMGYDSWDAFNNELQRHLRHVHEHFSQVFGAPQAGEAGEVARGGDAMAELWAGALSEAAALELLARTGYQDPAEALREIRALQASRSISTLTQTGRKRLDQLMPLLIGAAGGVEFADLALARTLRLVRTIAKRSVYLALLVENPLALSQLVQLCAESPWVADHLTRHPLLLDELLDARSLYAPPDRTVLAQELAEELLRVDQDDLEQLMDRLRLFKQVHVLKVAAADVMGVLPLMKVSDHLTWIAETVLDEVLAIAWRQMVQRHGEPACVVGGEARRANFGIIAYGKLGGIELGYGSDLDIVFVHDSEGEEQYTGGDKCIDNATFFARLAQRIIHILTALTPAGTLYEVDTRLRPSGASGLMVSSLNAFTHYQRNEAWTWEHQALVRARPVSGDAAIAEAFGAIRREILERPRERDVLRREVREMREKMWAELGSREAGAFNLKKDPGGIADIEFMVQYNVLAYAHDYPALSVYPDNIRILETLAECQLMSADDAHVLMDAYRAFRDRVHELTLQELPSVVPEAEHADDRAAVRRLWQSIMEA